MKKAVLLLSGGLDSATTLAMARAQGFEVYALSFRYGQRHAVELKAAARLAEVMGAAEHKIADIDLRLFGGSALTADIDVPKDRSGEEMAHGIPITYVPARNTIFLSFALAWAEVLGAYDIFIGVNALDYSGYPDCRPEFIEAFERTANLATAYGVEATVNSAVSKQMKSSAASAVVPLPLRERLGEGALKLSASPSSPLTQPSPARGEGSQASTTLIRIHTPIIAMTKAQIIAQGLKLGVNYSLTISCYDPIEGKPCGTCDSCQLRNKGFAENGMRDPTL